METWHLASSSLAIGNIVVMSSVTVEVCPGCPGAAQTRAKWTRGSTAMAPPLIPTPVVTSGA